MSLLGLLLLLLLICVIIWAARALLTAFSIGEPISTVVWVVIVLICVFAFVSQTGLIGGGELGNIRLGR